jgi:hypothetical protein
MRKSAYQIEQILDTSTWIFVFEHLQYGHIIEHYTAALKHQNNMQEPICIVHTWSGMREMDPRVSTIQHEGTRRMCMRKSAYQIEQILDTSTWIFVFEHLQYKYPISVQFGRHFSSYTYAESLHGTSPDAIWTSLGHAVAKGCIVETRGSISLIPLQVCTMQIGSCMLFIQYLFNLVGTFPHTHTPSPFMEPPRMLYGPV